MNSLAEARFYRKAAGRAVDCVLCSHRCHIGQGKRGACRVRENRDGTLYSLVYGRLVAQHVDPIEKKPLYHFLPGTGSYSIATPGCNFRCRFCQNWQISQTEALQAFAALTYVSPSEVVQAAVAARVESISYTYTEPTIFMEYALDCAELAKQRGLRNVFVTNGYESSEAVEEMTGLVDAANVDLKAFTEEFYRKECNARLRPVLDAIRAMYEGGIHIEVTTLIVPDLNDSDEEMRGIAQYVAGLSPEIPWHISRFHPDYMETGLPPTPLETMQRALELGREAGLHYVYMGNVLTADGQVTRCPDCGRVLVRRAGFSRPEVGLQQPECPGCGRAIPIVVS